MSVSVNPSIASKNIVLSIDPANPRCYNPSENLILRSNEFSTSSPWSLGEYTYVTNSDIGPFGTRNAMQATNTGASNNFNFNAQFVTRTDQGYYTYSIYFKNIDATSFTMLLGLNGLQYNVTGLYTVATNTFTVSFGPNNSVVSFGMTELAGGWKRLYLTIDTVLLLAHYSQVNLTNLAVGFYVGIPGATSASLNRRVLIFGSQFEKSFGPSNYVGTTTAASPKSTICTNLQAGESIIGTLTNNPIVSNSGTRSWYFDGTSSFINFSQPNIRLTSNEITVSLWLRADGVVANDNDKASGAIEVFNLQPIWNNGGTNGRFELWLNGAYRAVSANTTNQNQWNMYTGTYDGTSIKFYQNGTLLNTATFVGGAFSGYGGNLSLGAFSGLTNTKGNIGQYLLYNRALTDSEVYNNFNATRSRYGA
jgi:hypothetical protein